MLGNSLNTRNPHDLEAKEQLARLIKQQQEASEKLYEAIFRSNSNNPVLPMASDLSPSATPEDTQLINNGVELALKLDQILPAVLTGNKEAAQKVTATDSLN